MALLHLADRVSIVRASARAGSKGEIHPAICLLTGFGVIAAAGVAVHLLFRMIF